ncbi:MAG: DUF1015 domain-containing protein [Oscillospiraceae bacterium]|nr:DUF1015 domain-containing protein [Oscillospiraceae bacterium]
MERNGFYPADILLPHGVDWQKWSVVACDQYTSERGYWDGVERFVGDSPSTLRLTLPEVYLEDGGQEERVAKINAAMEQYRAQGVLRPAGPGFVFVERTLHGGSVRRGLVGMVDLEDYDFGKGSQSLIRATEGTVLERIPPRVKVRQGASLELPHVMLLIDDRERRVIEPLAAQTGKMERLYDFSLMMDSGSLRGWRLGEEQEKAVARALGALKDQGHFERTYGVSGKGVLLFAVGDGNHSLATAKTCWESIKKGLSEEERRAHPARFALVELVNLHDEALQFEPIHRVAFGIDPQHLLEEMGRVYEIGGEAAQGQVFIAQWGENKRVVRVKTPVSNLTVGTLQAFLDDYIARFGGRVDYIHGEEAVDALAREDGNMGFYLPAMKKEELFPTVILDGALPRKTFSMGHAEDKRFYLECRAIRK